MEKENPNEDTKDNLAEIFNTEGWEIRIVADTFLQQSNCVCYEARCS